MTGKGPVGFIVTLAGRRLDSRVAARKEAPAKGAGAKSMQYFWLATYLTHSRGAAKGASHTFAAGNYR
jgi:hypothetical protein